MRDLMPSLPSIDDRAACAIAAAMRLVADADGAHPRELELIEQLESTITTKGKADFEAIDSDELREAFVKSLALVAFADGLVSDQEGEVISELAGKVGASSELVSRSINEVAQVLLAQLAGARIFRDEVVALGKQMGLDEETIRNVLD